MNARPSFLLLSMAALVTGFAAMAADPPAKAMDGAWVGANGMTLYTYDRDAAPGKSACNGPCAANWPPLLAAAGAADMGDWTLITRDDGAKQWAYKGKPLYFWSKDQKAGDRSGDGVMNVWHVAKP